MHAKHKGSAHTLPIRNFCNPKKILCFYVFSCLCREYLYTIAQFQILKTPRCNLIIKVTALAKLNANLVFGLFDFRIVR